MRSSFSSNTSSQIGSSQRRLRTHWRTLALGCAAVGGVGVLWLPGSAQSPAIVPENADPAPVVAPLPEMTPNSAPRSPGVIANSEAISAPAPAPKTQPATPAENRISIEMHDIPVTQLLMLVSGQGDVSITVGTDVDSKTVVPFIRLNNVTPEDAIERAAMAAGLQWKKLDEKTYFVGKNLPDGLGSKSSSNRNTGSSAIQPIDENWLTVQTQATQSPMSALPPYGGSNSSYSAGLVPLANKAPQQEKEIHPIRIRNVRSGLMAWWLDPKNQELPIEVQASDQAKKRAINPYPLMPGVDPNISMALNGNSGANMAFANPYAASSFANPYANPAAVNPWMRPEYRGNFLFGGGGGGGFGGGGGGFGGNRGGQGGQNSGGILDFGMDPANPQYQLVDQIISIDAQNVLLVYGTGEGIRRLTEIIEFLDRPIRQVEIESQFIDISVTDAKAFGIQFFNRGFLQNSGDDDDDNITPNTFGTLPNTDGTNTLVFTRGDVQLRLQALASSGRARIINSPRVTTMNNLTASLVSQNQTPVVLTSTETGIGGQVGEQQNAFFLTTSIGIQVTPTIQNDDSITVFLTPQVSVQVPNPSLGGQINTGDDDDDNDNVAASIPAVSSQFLTTVANVKDNDVIVLGGLRTRTQNIVKSRIPVLSKIPIIGRLFRSQNITDVDRELVIFLTARILRRSDDVTPIQGP